MKKNNFDVDVKKEVNKKMKSMDFSEEVFTRLENKLLELKKYAISNNFSESQFRKKVNTVFNDPILLSKSKEVVKLQKQELLLYCHSKKQAILTIDKLIAMTKPLADSMQHKIALFEFAKSYMDEVDSFFSK